MVKSIIGVVSAIALSILAWAGAANIKHWDQLLASLNDIQISLSLVGAILAAVLGLLTKQPKEIVAQYKANRALRLANRQK